MPLCLPAKPSSSPLLCLLPDMIRGTERQRHPDQLRLPDQTHHCPLAQGAAKDMLLDFPLGLMI
jgi:hypothetical protein